MLSPCAAASAPFSVGSSVASAPFGSGFPRDTAAQSCRDMAVSLGWVFVNASDSQCVVSPQYGGVAYTYPVIVSCASPLDPVNLDPSVVAYVYAWAFGAILGAFLLGYALSVGKAMIEKL